MKIFNVLFKFNADKIANYDLNNISYVKTMLNVHRSCMFNKYILHFRKKKQILFYSS